MRRTWPTSIGMLLLAIWLILTGLTAFASLGSLGILLPLLALIAGILILIGR